MHLYHSGGSNWPISIKTIPTISVNLPSFTEAYDGDRISSTSALGNQKEAINGTIGEFLERRHFYNEPFTKKSMMLSDMFKNSNVLDAFVKMFQQTANSDSPNIDSYKFYSTQAFNLFTFNKCQIPSIFLTLSNKRIGTDHYFLPFRDTTGCAVHTNFNFALNGALGELIERQCLLRFWLTKEVPEEIEIDNSLYNLRKEVSILIQKLLSCGYLKLYDITIPNFPGYAVFAIFGTEDNLRPVRFCSGLSYHFSAQKAIEKSILELWQIFYILHESIVSGVDGNSITDCYHRHFWFSNKIESYHNLTETKPLLETTLESYLMRGTINQEDLHKHIYDLTKNIYIYTTNENIGNTVLRFVRVICPDFFIHMNCTAPLNFNNMISQEFPYIHTERKESLVLFP